LRETLQKIRSLDRSPAQDTYWSRNNDQWVERHTSSGEISDETLAAMAILCNFEYMSASDSEWFSHLSGTMLVWNLTQPSIMSLLSPRASKARKAIFWNLFRQDVFAACSFIAYLLLLTCTDAMYSYPRRKTQFGRRGHPYVEDVRVGARRPRPRSPVNR
jgi:hypothetical protein